MSSSTHLSALQSTLPSDEELASSVMSGNLAALEALIERHHSSLLGYLYRMTAGHGGGDRWLAEDLVQETFLRALRGIHQYQPSRRFKPWLYAIATNLARDHYKSADTRLTASFQDTEPENDYATTSSPEDGLVKSDEARRVFGAIRSLSPQQREAVILRYYQGLSLAEIAEALDIPLGTVKSRLSLGLQRLKAALE